MNTLVVIQARMGSSRLPGKVLMPLGDHLVIDFVVRRCKMIKNIMGVVVATSDQPQDDSIVEWCKMNKISYFRGSEEDVLSRYVHASQQYQPSHVIRVTADCPFVDYELANIFIDEMIKHPSEFVLLHGPIPRGLAIELMTYDALLRINAESHKSRHREHVTLFIYENKELFTTIHVKVPQALQYPELRLTIDTAEDYSLCNAVATAFVGNLTVSSQEIIRFLNNNPDIARLNSHIVQKPVV